MRRVDLANGAGLLVALVAASLATLVGPSERNGRTGAPTPTLTLEVVTGEDGGRALLDATGTPVPLLRYERIASASTISDHLVLELAEPERLVAITRFTAENEHYAYRFGERPTVRDITDTEALLDLAPDLLFVNDVFHGASGVTRLREAGITVFDLGPMRGMSTFLPNIEAVAMLVGAPERGAELRERFVRRMERVAAHLAPEERKRGLYLSTYGEQLYGGTIGTSFHDVLEHAGVIDLAAERYEGWPRFSTEQVLEMDPPLIVTREGGAGAVCRHPGFERVAACRRPGGVVEVTSNTFESPGLQMLDAVEELHAKVYGDDAGRAR